MGFGIPVTYENLQDAYDDVIVQIEKVFDLQRHVNDLETQKADLWAEMCRNPDFKPGKSNLEQAAKLRANYPDFMDEYEETVRDYEDGKLKLDKYRLEVEKLSSFLRLGEILVTVESRLK